MLIRLQKEKQIPIKLLDSNQKNPYIRISGYNIMATIKDHRVFKALSEPVRLRIAVLLTEGEICVCELTAVLRLPQSTVSRHMARLKSEGMVADRRKGKWIYYRATGRGHWLLDTLVSYFSRLRSKQPHKGDLDKLARHRQKKRCE